VTRKRERQRARTHKVGAGHRLSATESRVSVPAGRLLLISYFFPPTAGGGVFRPLAMVKYLVRFGWNITVLTATTPRHYPTDSDLLKQVPAGVEVIRLPVVWEGSFARRALGKIGLDWIPRHLVTPDERVFWAERAANRARRLIREHDFDCLYTTGPPFSILLCGMWLKREKGIDIPWLAEFRDPWTLAPYLSIPNLYHRRFARDAEADLMRLADAIVMVTPAFARMMRAKYPDSEARVHCVPNGYDPEDFRNLPDKHESRNESCTIVASGTVFGRYNMDEFLRGLERLKKTEPGVYAKLRVSFQGLPDANLNRRLLENDMIDRCSSRGFVGHATNIRDLWTADLLVLPLADVPNSAGHIPSRAYEYLASRRPILAVCPDGDLADLLAGFPQVTRVRPGDTERVIEALKEAVSRWETGIQAPEPDMDSLRSLSRRERAVEMDRILKAISFSRSG